MYKTILVPHGGTPAGDESLRHAIHLAKSSTAKIILLHVIEDIPIPPSFALSQSEREKLVDDIGNANKTMRESFEKNLIEKLAEYKNSGIVIEHNVVSGDAAEEILKTIQEKNIDLVVMAKRRKLKGLKKLLSLGSVSRKIVEHATCPVYLIDIENI
ncbi:universal stress protein UspA [Nitrosopumilus cobalaminigenes]|uniref:Universal stress protein UspA n=1 Tax=Nitrosopumilus cobalaminigenes TaxID=1470066 RepID=A0A7D5M327_9ARCH|nr:universal stress protein [Nitrosopumilus cobalaminigenes]QLH03350.1 universal stress protein UspA [Nitrosopumilus cobalaminigenes]